MEFTGVVVGIILFISVYFCVGITLRFMGVVDTRYVDPIAFCGSSAVRVDWCTCIHKPLGLDAYLEQLVALECGIFQRRRLA
ncbi:hypothetical protein X766_25785 [Mesorhizobium sp. LSJC255A00]|nr:hypothetical protein X766_25785 [Mesorhizobium sp. LSJC255A00]